MHLHILGICGTFMGGVAAIARAAGHRVTGCDANVYPPMSDQLRALDIALIEGYDPAQLELKADIYVIGNVITRGNPLMEAILNRGLPYISGPQWLTEQVLCDKWVLAVAGTHGKTTTSAMLAWILEHAGLQPSFLIGGIPQNFGISARLTELPFFVIEADEYDTAFFDKRSKFVHYRPRTVILNNLEFDHADIFADLSAIETQFHHLLRTVPGEGLIIAPPDEASLQRVIARGCWTAVEYFGTREGWRAEGGESVFEVYFKDVKQGVVTWPLIGAHNVRNALAAMAAARHAGVAAAVACDALSGFENVKRRMEVRGSVHGITVYDDFAHHPTAIATTLAGLRRKIGNARILAVLEPRSNTMKLGAMNRELPPSLRAADVVFCYSANLAWDAQAVFAGMGSVARIYDDMNRLVAAVAAEAQTGDHILIMSNGGFEGIHERLLRSLNDTYASAL